jgi:threonine dehydrogenase-like Zn-dependent dehydrogenase
MILIPAPCTSSFFLSLDNDWGISNFPVVLGHEGIGVVCTVGDCVKNLQVGDTVGITWIRDSCRSWYVHKTLIRPNDFILQYHHAHNYFD